MQIIKLLLKFIIVFQLSFVNTSIATEEEIAQEQGFIVLAFQMSQCQTEQGRWKQGVITVKVPPELETAASPDIDCTELLQLQMSVLEQGVDKEEYFQCATQDWAIEDSLPLAKNLVLKLNEVYNCPGEKQDFMDCAGDIGCNIMKSLPISNVAMKAVEYFSDGKYQQCQNETDTNCLSEVFYGIVKNLTTNIGGTVDGAIWVKDKLCFWCETEEVENASSESMHMASTQEDGFFDRFMEDPYDATIGAIGRLFSGLGSMIQEGIENNFGCAKWAEPRYTSIAGNEPKCEEPIISWDCASCSQKLNMACGVVGFMGGEVVMAVLTGGVANVAAKVGKAIGAAGVIAKVAEKAATGIDKVSSAFNKLGKIKGASPMSSINGWGIVKAGEKFAFKVGNRLIPLNDKTLALLRGAGGAAKGAIDLALWTPKKYLQLLEEAFIFGQRGPKGLALYQASKLGDNAEKAARAAENASKYPGKEGLALEKLEKQVGTLQEQYVAKVQQLMSKKPMSAADEMELKRIEDQIDKAKVAASRMKSNLDKAAKQKSEAATEQVKSNSRLSDTELKNKAEQKIKANNPRMSQEEVDVASQAVVDARKKFPNDIAGQIKTMKEAGIPQSQYRDFIRQGLTETKPRVSQLNSPIPIKDSGATKAREYPRGMNPNQANLYPELRNFRLKFRDGIIDGDTRYVYYKDPVTRKKVLVELDPTDLNNVGGIPILKGRAYRPGKDGAPGTFEPVVLKPDDLKTVGISKQAKDVHTDPYRVRGADEPRYLNPSEVRPNKEVSIISNGGEYQNAQITKVDKANNMAVVRYKDSSGATFTERVEINSLRTRNGSTSSSPASRSSVSEAEEIVRKRSEKVSSNVEVKRNVTDRARNNANLSDKQKRNKVSKLLRQRNPKIKNKQLKERTQAVMDAHEKFPCEVGRCTTQQLAGKIEIMKAAGIPKDMYRKLLKEGYAGFPQRPSVAEIGTAVKVRRSNGTESNAQVTDYDPKTNEATVTFIEGGEVLQKRVNASTLQGRAVDAGDAHIEAGVRVTGSPGYSVRRNVHSPSPTQSANIGQPRVASTSSSKPQLGDSIKGSYQNGNEFEGKLMHVDREKGTITLEVELGNGDKVQQVIHRNQMRSLAKVNNPVRTPTSNPAIPNQKPVVEKPVSSPQKIKEDTPVVEVKPKAADDLIERAEAKLPADLKDHFRSLDPQAQRAMAQQVNGLSDQGREGLYDFVRQEIKANQQVANVKPVRMLDDDQEQLVVYSVNEYMEKQEEYNKIRRKLKEKPNFMREWRLDKLGKLKKEMREIKGKVRSENGQDVADELTERVNERMQTMRSTNAEQRLAKNKAQMEMNERIAKTADEIPDDIKDYYRSLSREEQDIMAKQLVGQSDEWKEGYYSLQRQQMSVANAEKSRKVVETRGDPSNLNINSVKLDGELKNLRESLNSASRNGKADTRTTPDQTGQNIRTDRGEIVPVHTTNQEYRSMASELVEKGSGYARPHSVSRMETDMAGSGLSRDELNKMYERFGELPGETGLSSTQAMEKAIKFIEKIPEGQRTQAQSYILDKSKKYSQYFRLSQAQKKFKEASNITDNEKRLEHSEKAWKYAEDYLPPEVLEKLKKTLSPTQMPFGL